MRRPVVLGMGLIAALGAVVAAAAGTLTSAQIEKLDTYAAATVRYFTSADANNLLVGFPHAFFGTGRFRTCDAPGDCHEVVWPLTRGYGSHVNINEVTLRFVSLAAAYKMGWLSYLPAEEQYPASWGQVLVGLQTLRFLQTSGNTNHYRDGHFHRSYVTVIERNGRYDLDRTTAELLCSDGDSLQSSDDNALPFMNLLVLEGLANDVSVSIPDRSQIVELCEAVRAAIDLRGFVTDDHKIAHEIRNGQQSDACWDRLSAEGAILLAALRVSGQIDESQFERIYASLHNDHDPVAWPTCSGGTITIGKSSYHAAMFIHALRAIHGIPVTATEVPGLDYFATSTRPVFAAQIDYAQCRGLQALGSQAMTQILDGEPVFEAGGVQVQFPGNEDRRVPVPDVSLSPLTGSHAWLVALQRVQELAADDIAQLFAWMGSYEGEFFHSGSDVELGWEAAIPWNANDHAVGWRASDSTWRYTDWGRPFEALNSAYILLGIFDALNPSTPLASFNVNAQELERVAFYLDRGCWPAEAPSAIVATDGVFAAKVRVSWALVTGASRYEVYRAPAACDTYAELGETTTSTFDDTSVTPQQAYWYEVRACNACGCSDPSSADVGHAGTPGGGSAAVFGVDQEGSVWADGGFTGLCYATGFADVAEWVRVTEPVQPGDVLELDPTQPGSYRMARGLATTLVAGVVSTEPGFVLGSPTHYLLPTTNAHALLALSGIVPVKVTNEGGPIQPGDLLVSSSTPGYAMRWAGDGPCLCALVGKALDVLPLGQGSGLVSVLLTAH
jgi:hypothetical protein